MISLFKIAQRGADKLVECSSVSAGYGQVARRDSEPKYSCKINLSGHYATLSSADARSLAAILLKAADSADERNAEHRS